jgi:hypothetical protein
MIGMSMRELERLKVLKGTINGHITQKVAASILGLSERQVRVIREEGDRDVIHKSRGLPSNRQISDHVKERVLSLYQSKYGLPP